MLRWVVEYISRNEQRWERRRKDEEEKRETEEKEDYERWIKLRHEKKKILLQDETRLDKQVMSKEQRLEEVIKMKKIWKEERSKSREEEEAAEDENKADREENPDPEEEDKWPEENVAETATEEV